MTRITIVIAAGLAFSATFSAVPAHAQRARVFVASYGNDSNPCTFGSPCKTFQQAVTVVAAGGEVTAIDSGGFQPVNITKSVTITSPPGIEAGIAPTADAVDIDAPGATVVLRGLTLLGAGGASNGVNFSAGSRIEIIDCVISDFAGYGIWIGTPAATTVMISNTIATDNGDAGISLSTKGTGSITAALDHVTLSNNQWGVLTNAPGGPIEVQVADSHIDNNFIGFLLQGSEGSGTGSVSNVVMRNVTLNQPTSTGVSLNGDSSVWFSQVTGAIAPGFLPIPIGVNFSGSNNQALSDNTSHLGSIVGGSIGLWGFQ